VAAGLLALLVLAFAAPSLVIAATDDDLDKYQEEYNAVQKQIEDNNRRLQETLSQKRRILGELSRVQQQLEATERDLDRLNRDLAASEARLAEAARALQQAEAELSWRTGLLQRRVRALYEYGSVSYLEVLLSARRFGDFLNRFDLLRIIVSQDYQLFRDVARLREECATNRALVAQERDHVQSLKAQAELAAEKRRSQVAYQQDLLDAAQKDEAQYRRALDELEELSNQLVKRIQDLQAQLGYERTGPLSMVWPTAGRITSYFGPRYHPILRQTRNHTGIDIAAAMGQPVVTAEAGVVIYSGWLGGYGKAIIIDHGGGVSTLYGHCSQLLVAYGARVTRGQNIARAGSTGFSTGPHLHFEVRQDGVPVNPLRWLPG
jgi:murein DD-endopeptidase MepM/ murein hydrolase activator NlpD